MLMIFNDAVAPIKQTSANITKIYPEWTGKQKEPKNKQVQKILIGYPKEDRKTGRADEQTGAKDSQKCQK